MLGWILTTLVLVLLVYFYGVQPQQHWKQRGVKTGTLLQLIKTQWRTLLRKQSLAEMVLEVYNMFPHARYSGVYMFSAPSLVMKDPDLIKQITVKDFDHFTDHRPFIAEGPFSNNLFSLTGQKWRDMRSTLSPAFTGSKMKVMFALIMENAEEFTNYFLKQNKEVIEVEMRDAFTPFTNDVIANTAFGFKCDSLVERDNEFYLMGKEVADFSSPWKMIKTVGYFLMPQLYKIFKISFFNEETIAYFHSLVMRNISDREKNGIVRQDMIHLLMQAKKNNLKHDVHDGHDTEFATVQETGTRRSTKKVQITDEDIRDQALVFFIAGFDAVSSLMSFMSYELGVNQGIQERLRQEIDETSEACNGKPTNEVLLGMKYMDMVVSETLRKWPNAVAVDRVCTKPYTIQPKNPDEKPVELKEGDILMLPIFGLQRDPKNYRDPDRFDPERFSDENKHMINLYTYVPFGVGPRACIGSRLAIMETKTMFFKLLSHFEIHPVEKTRIPLVISRKQFNLNSEGGYWFALKRRTSNRF